ncbi:ABC transporter substrate-binding protein [Tengunoibacter tsumagoiensis]|uniref:Peptide ABC transporter substrate-binding protein n=1 Tax=Tengunoibacter tsumagoiensis TaxID=2014871 RepID=A0A402A9Y5_9CHLR|nr:ABC transporter substrate-binding protein [Tengunoibacter tsumagoiensis]GCE15994.1 peptide ABC transporter substrate-binding protein [Tengunoibacter tsumagoiensis]
MSNTSFFSGTKAKTGFMLCSLLVVFGLLLTACGGANSTKTSAAKHDYLTIQTGPNGDFTRVFNPYAAVGGDPGTSGLIYETLLYINQLNGDVKPWLASSYNLSSDAKTLTFTTRSNVQWSDGQPFTAEDVAFTFNLLKQYPAADGNALWNYFQDVTATDDHTVTITLKQPYSPILWYAGGNTWILPKHIWSSVGDISKYPNPDPVGTGPFKLKSFTPQLYTMEQNTSFWGTKPAVKELRYPAYNSNTSVELDLNKGNLDWTGLFTPQIDKTFVKPDPTHHKYWFAPGGLVMIVLNNAKAPFNNIAVRKAISTALDRDQMYHVAESGYEPVAHPTGVIVPNFNSYLAPEYKDASFKLDTNAATKLLEDAGYKKGSDGIYADKDGNRLSFKLNVVTGWTDWVTICQIASQNLKAIGMDVTVNPLSYAAYTNALQMGDYDASINSPAGGPSPYFMYNGFLNSAGSAPIGQKASTNYARWMDKTTDDLLNQYVSTTDKDAQLKAVQGLEKVMVEQVPTVPLVYGVSWYEYNTTNFVNWPDKDHQYSVASPYTYPDAEQVVLNLQPAK